MPIDEILSDVLNLEDAEAVIVRKKGCQVLFMNQAAKRHLEESKYQKAGMNCKTGYSRLFPGLCDNCPDEGKEKSFPPVFDIEERKGGIFSAKRNHLQWIDGKSARMFFLRDVSEERATRQKFYNLAYIDALTGLPNRQELREDFEKIAEGIANKKIHGALAVFDLDNFKSVNDTYGHNTGDMMLRRLSEHLQGEADYAGRIYRLGGDEFVFLFSYPVEPDGSSDGIDSRKFFDKILDGAFLEYTMPTIELSCTISMGIALFPKHGGSFSELLRKADIALYEAKADGRNKKVFFEDWFDTARKFKDLYVNIQPVLLASGQTFGYELVDKGNSFAEEKNKINLTEADRTLDILNLSDLENNARYLISYSNHLMEETVRRNLPKDKFIIEVSAYDVYADKTLQKYHKLKSFGYAIAAVGVKNANATPELLELADYIKFDNRGVSAFFQEKLISHNPKIVFIATKVDTSAQFEAAKSLGYKLFQGYFFNHQPILKKTKEIDPLYFNYVKLLKLSSSGHYINFKEISSVIASDVALTYKLLKLLNSAAVGLRNITSISMAVSYLGEDNLKKWIALLALRGVVSYQPLELVRMSLIRAQFGELLAPYFRIKRDPKQVFLVGLLSLLHIALDKTKEELLAEMPVADDIRESLLTSTGVYSGLLEFFSNYEYGNWDDVAYFVKEHHLENQLVNDFYISAVKWYNDLINALE